MTIVKAAQQLRVRKVSSVELTKESLGRIRESQRTLNAFITITDEVALRQATLADEELAKGIDRGPLHGIPYALKDMYCTRGILTTAGSKLFADYIPDRDAAVYERLTRAGAVLMGKTGLHELAYGITSQNPHFGPVRNPRDVTKLPGGSSGGSGAAVAADLVFFAMGSDTGGSIRIPAAFCRCFGLKPTSGRVSRYGTMPLDYSLDHMGPLTRSSQDAALVMNAIAGFDERDDTSSKRPVPDFDTQQGSNQPRLRIGVATNFFNERVDPSVRAAFDDAVQQVAKLGFSVERLEVPDPGALTTVGRVILLSEASALMETYLTRRELFGADVLSLFDQGRLLSATDYINAQRLRRQYQRSWARVWQTVDMLLTPTTPTEAPDSDAVSVMIDNREEDVRLASTRFVRCFNVLGCPAISTPYFGKYANILTGLQVVSAPFAESNLLRFSTALELAST